MKTNLKNYQRFSLFLILVFVTESLIMLIFHFVWEALHLPALIEAAADALLLMIVIMPIAYLTLYRPMALNMSFKEALIRGIPFGMDIIDKEGNILYTSPRLEAVLGKDLLGKKCWEVYRDNKTQCADCPLLKNNIDLERSGMIESSEILGGRVFQINHTPITYQGRKAVMEIFQDVSERKAAEEKARVFQAAIKQIADIVVMTDKDGVIEYVNPAFTRQTGYSSDEAVGRTSRILKSGRQDEIFYAKLWKTILQGRVFHSTVINKKKSGELYYSEKIITPIKDDSGNITHFISTDRDVTERKKTEEELARANAELRELDKQKSEFINMSSHELRTPVAIIKESLSQLADGLCGEFTLEQKRFLDISLRNINRLIRVMDNIFDISEIDFSQTFLKKEEVDIVELARRVIADSRPQAKNRGIELKESFSREKITLNADKKRLNQLLANLIDNAVKFSEKGYVEVKINDNGQTVECGVLDTGSGIPEEDIPKLFNKFRQFDKKPGPGDRGVGLGLALCKGIVKLHNGEIWAESKLGEGSKFTFVLPKAEK